jgi:DNA-binding NtrC family response regulator
LIVCVEDERKLLDLMVMNLKKEFSVRGFCSAEEFLESGSLQEVELVLTDIRLPGMDGIELLSRIKADKPHLPVVVMTAYGSIDQAVSAVKSGAYDYLTKPVSMRHIIDTVRNALDFRRTTASSGEDVPFASSRFLSEDSDTRSQVELAVRVSRKDVPVLILGETGTGKELIAELIHEQSGRKGLLVKMNCASIPEELFEGELFGYRKGAFTGAGDSYEGKILLADGGTLFLDEIGDMPQAVQPKLLRVLETGSFYPLGDNRIRRSDFRILAATNRNLREEVERGRFRQDLYYRIAVIPVRIPPLRDRSPDIRMLAEYFFREAFSQYRQERKPVDEDVFHLFSLYNWPGNVRELKSVVTRMVLTSGEDRISVREFPQDISLPPACRYRRASSYDELKEIKRSAREDAASEIERAFVVSILEESGYNVSKAAKAAGMDRRLLQNLMKRYGITRSPG